jgi:hypothetical protein
MAVSIHILTHMTVDYACCNTQDRHISSTHTHAQTHTASVCTVGCLREMDSWLSSIAMNGRYSQLFPLLLLPAGTRG